MDPTLTSAMAAVVGSLVGGFSSFAGNWAVQRAQVRRELLQCRTAYRQRLYSNFIKEASQLLAHSLTHQIDDPSRMVTLYAMVTKIRLFCSDPVLQAADAIMTKVFLNYGQTNLTIDQVRERVMSSHREDPFKEFGLACRQELDGVR